MDLHQPAPRLWVLSFVALVGTMAIMSFVAVVGPLVRLFGLADWHAGLALTAGGVLWTLSAGRWGRLSDRVGRKRVLMTALAAYAATYLILAVAVDAALGHPPAVAVSLAVLVGARALVGLFYAAVPTIAAAAVADQAASGKRASAMARLGAANAIGLVAGPVVAGWIATYDLALALYAAALMPVLALGLIAWKLPETVPSVAKPSFSGAENAEKLANKAAEKPAVGFLDVRLRLPLCAIFMAIMAVATTQSTVGFLVIDRLGLSLAEGARAAGYALTALGAGLILAQSTMMRIEWPPTRWLLIGALLASTGFGSVGVLSSTWLMLAAFGLAGLGMGLVRPAVQALTADSVEAHEQGAAAGTVAAMQGFAMTVGPLVGTLLYGLSSGAPYLLVGFLLLLLALVIWRQPSSDTSHRRAGVTS
ncbi:MULTISPECIES: MFS transporter [unclassified Halomonas]|uniref:MFS transporter n=1 Tax=unclassified Halomonas TaxID=2609666 RepID=UPI004034604F